jgi:hypothetical protein
MSALELLGIFLLGAAFGTLITRIARRREMDVRKNWGNLT